MGSKLSKEERRARDRARVKERVTIKRDEREWGAVLYALARGAAYRYLTDAEKEEFDRRKKLAERKREARESLDLDIQRELLWALKDGEDLDGDEVQSRIWKLKMRSVNSSDCPFTPKQAQQILRKL